MGLVDVLGFGGGSGLTAAALSYNYSSSAIAAATLGPLYPASLIGGGIIGYYASRLFSGRNKK